MQGFTNRFSQRNDHAFESFQDLMSQNVEAAKPVNMNERVTFIVSAEVKRQLQQRIANEVERQVHQSLSARIQHLFEERISTEVEHKVSERMAQLNDTINESMAAAMWLTELKSGGQVEQAQGLEAAASHASGVSLTGHFPFPSAYHLSAFLNSV
jgi:nitric oxide reductase activation protein